MKKKEIERQLTRLDELYDIYYCDQQKLIPAMSIERFWEIKKHRQDFIRSESIVID